MNYELTLFWLISKGAIFQSFMYSIMKHFHIQDGEAVDFDAQSVHLRCEGDDNGHDLAIVIPEFDLGSDATRRRLRNTVLKPGENPFEALGISSIR